jgi:hypothetical protein
MLKLGENGAREQSEFGALLKGGASMIALAAFSLAAPAYGQVAQGSTVANAADEDAETGQDADAASSSQAPGAEEDGAIVVTGIRQSLKSSQDIKRNADVVVDRRRYRRASRPLGHRGAAAHPGRCHRPLLGWPRSGPLLR